MAFDPNAKKEIDAYIKSMPAFSKAICTKLRSIILKAAPGIVEDWKWGPNYNFDGMVCGYGAFRKHVIFHFFNGAAMSDSKRIFNHGMDNDFTRGMRFEDVRELDENALALYVKESVTLNMKGFKRVKKEKDVVCPDDLALALKKKAAALKFFDSLANGYKNEFIESVVTAKREETRKQRIEKVVKLCSESTKLNDKYKK